MRLLAGRGDMDAVDGFFWTHNLRGCVAQYFLRHLIDLMIRKVIFLVLCYRVFRASGV